MATKITKTKTKKLEKKQSKNKVGITKVMIFGTFDGVHKGHLNFFTQARNLAKNSYVIVSIARDVNVKKIKGKLPFNNEKKRKLLVQKSKLVHKVVLSGLKNYIGHIKKELPDVIALGYDQKAYVKELKSNLNDKLKHVKIVRLKPYKEKIYKNSLLHAKK